MHLGGGLVGRRLLPGGDGGVEPLVIDAITRRQGFEESEPRPDAELVVARENFAGERDAGGFAAARQQVFAQLEKALRPRGCIAAPLSAEVEQSPAAVGDRLQQFAKKRCVHYLPERAGPIR